MRRAAVLAFSAPLETAWSKRFWAIRKAASAPSASPAATASCTVRVRVFNSERMARLRRLRTIVCRLRFFCDLVWAIAGQDSAPRRKVQDGAPRPAPRINLGGIYSR